VNNQEFFRKSLDMGIISVSRGRAVSMHCKQDPIYVFAEMKLRGLISGSCRNWKRGWAVSFLGMFVYNFRFCVFTVYLKTQLAWANRFRWNFYYYYYYFIISVSRGRALSMHCKQDPLYVFTEMKLRGLISDSCRNWKRGWAVSFLGMFVYNFRFCVFTVYLKTGLANRFRWNFFFCVGWLPYPTSHFPPDLILYVNLVAMVDNLSVLRPGSPSITVLVFLTSLMHITYITFRPNTRD
jgi:hypothetical protein